MKEIALLQFPIKCLIYPLILLLQRSICSDSQQQDCNFSAVMEATPLPLHLLLFRDDNGHHFWEIIPLNKNASLD